MKFYNYHVNWHGDTVEEYESVNGRWATRDDAEQAAKDAVEIAQALQRYLRTFRNDDDHVLWQQAQTIIERYEGGKNV